MYILFTFIIYITVISSGILTIHSIFNYDAQYFLVLALMSIVCFIYLLFHTRGFNSLNSILSNSPKPHGFLSLSLQSGKAFITIFIYGIAVTIPSSCLSAVKHFGIGFLLGFPLFTNIVVYAMTGNVVMEGLEGQVQNILIDLNRLIPQLSNFINQFHNFINETGINVITSGEGELGIDVDQSLSDSVALQYATRINVLDSLIHNHIHSIEELLETGSLIEGEIIQSNSNYVSQISELSERFTQLIHSYKH